MLPTSLDQFRSFILRIRDTAEPGWGEAELVPWLEHSPELREELHRWGAPEAHTVRFGRGDMDTLWGLYAVSRLVDILLAPHQPEVVDQSLLDWTTGKPWWRGPSAAPGAWPAFSRAIGASVIAEDSFHPFFHEIVAVESADDPDEPVSLMSEVWPGALIGTLLLARSGVVVRAGENVLDPSVAAHSCMYFTWWRRNRVVRDLSHGWGHNSQWGTEFRRDYVVGDLLHYNVDHSLTTRNPADQDEDITAAERVDLLRFRHSVRRDLGDDRWPYYESLVEWRGQTT